LNNSVNYPSAVRAWSARRIVGISGFTVRPAREGMKLETDPASRT
jgi:hypothetical protein